MMNDNERLFKPPEPTRADGEPPARAIRKRRSGAPRKRRVKRTKPRLPSRKGVILDLRAVRAYPWSRVRTCKPLVLYLSLLALGQRDRNPRNWHRLFWVRLDEMRFVSNLSPSDVLQWLDWLEKEGFVEIVKRGRGHYSPYRMRILSEWYRRNRGWIIKQGTMRGKKPKTPDGSADQEMM